MTMQRDDQLTIGAVYAEALLDLATQGKVEDQIGEELRELVRLGESLPDLPVFAPAGSSDMGERSAWLDRYLRGRASDLLVNALHVMNRKGRLAAYRGLADSYALLLEKRRSITRVAVKSAVEMSSAQVDRLRDVLSKLLGGEVLIASSVDPSVIGGLSVTVGDRKLDATVATQVATLSEKLLGRAEREMQSAARVVEGSV